MPAPIDLTKVTLPRFGHVFPADFLARVQDLETLANSRSDETAFDTAVVVPVHQTNHGFVVGNVVRLASPFTYTLAQADSAVDAAAVGVVSAVNDCDNFELTQIGWMDGLDGLTVAVPYYLSATVAGKFTTTEPTAVGQVSKPVLVADTSTSGYVLGGATTTANVVAAPVGSVPAVVIPVAQTAHGFAVGDVVRLQVASGGLASADSFNRANNASTPGSTDGAGSTDPRAWTQQSGTWGISSNQLYCPVAPGNLTIDLGEADVDITVTLATTDTNGQGIILRYTDESNYVLYRGDNTQLTLTKRVAGSPSSIITTMGTISSGEILRIVAIGSSYSCYKNGTLLNTGSDSFNNTATKAGLRSQGSGTQKFDTWSASTPVIPAGYVKAKADNATDADAVGVVSEVVDSDHFAFTELGRITGLAGLVAGTSYYLSTSTAGAVQTTNPTATGTVSKPIYVAESTTSAIVLNYRGSLNP
jgi:hypothetical protein